jgi:hypothetical protein
MPAGVPETVPIFCNGRTAVLDLRSQRVMHEGEEMPPSRFEQVCGKGDAKKWKATLYHFDELNQKPTMCMQVRAGCGRACMRVSALTRAPMQCMLVRVGAPESTRAASCSTGP